MLERVLVFETGHRADVARTLSAERTNAAGFRVAVIDFLKISNRDADRRRPLPLVHWALHRPQSRRRMSAFRASRHLRLTGSSEAVRETYCHWAGLWARVLKGDCANVLIRTDPTGRSRLIRRSCRLSSGRSPQSAREARPLRRHPGRRRSPVGKLPRTDGGLGRTDASPRDRPGSRLRRTQWGVSRLSAFGDQSTI